MNRSFVSLVLPSWILIACGSAPTAEPQSPPPSTAPPVATAETSTEETQSHIDILSPKGPAEIKLDGKSIGKTPIDHYLITPGRHDVTFVYGPGDEQTLSVNVAAGKEATVKLDHVPPIKEH